MELSTIDLVFLELYILLVTCMAIAAFEHQWIIILRRIDPFYIKLEDHFSINPDGNFTMETSTYERNSFYTYHKIGTSFSSSPKIRNNFWEKLIEQIHKKYAVTLLSKNAKESEISTPATYQKIKGLKAGATYTLLSSNINENTIENKSKEELIREATIRRNVSTIIAISILCARLLHSFHY